MRAHGKYGQTFDNKPFAANSKHLCILCCIYVFIDAYMFITKG